MLKVAKFGGSSMADAGQYQKIRDIIRSDPSRRVVVVSAAGKRSAGDNKITDLLYLCYAHLQYGVSCDGIYQMIRERYGDIHRRARPAGRSRGRARPPAQSDGAGHFPR